MKVLKGNSHFVNSIDKNIWPQSMVFCYHNYSYLLWEKLFLWSRSDKLEQSEFKLEKIIGI